MTTYQDIRSGRRLIWAGIAIGYALAVAVAVLNLVDGEGTLLSAASFLLALSIPPTMAATSLDRRPSLLTAASMASLLVGFLLLFAGIGLVYFVPAILWTLAVQRRPRPAPAPDWVTWVRPLIAASVILPIVVLFVHLDPRCTVTAADGTVISTRVDDNAPSGWGFQPYGSGSSSTSSDGETVSCNSNTLQPWESVASIALSIAIIGAIVRFWPYNQRLTDSNHALESSFGTQ